MPEPLTRKEVRKIRRARGVEEARRAKIRAEREASEEYLQEERALNARWGRDLGIALPAPRVAKPPPSREIPKRVRIQDSPVLGPAVPVQPKTPEELREEDPWNLLVWGPTPASRAAVQQRREVREALIRAPKRKRAAKSTLTHDLRASEVYVLSPDMMKMTQACARLLTASEVLEHPTNGWGDGFLFLPHPLRPREDSKTYIRAISWVSMPGGVRFTLWRDNLQTFGDRLGISPVSVLYIRNLLMRKSRTPHFVLAFLRLAEQQITTTTSVPDHEAGATPAKTGAEAPPDIRVTELRRAKTRRGEEPGTVDWSSRWIVSAHKVRQWYPKEQKHKIIFRGPYVKGPADKPLKTTPIVKALVR